MIAVVGLSFRETGFLDGLCAPRRARRPRSVDRCRGSGLACFGSALACSATAGPSRVSRPGSGGWSPGGPSTDAVAVAVFSGLAEEALMRALLQPVIGLVPGRRRSLPCSTSCPTGSCGSGRFSRSLCGLVLGGLFDVWGYPAAAAAHVVINALALLRLRATDECVIGSTESTLTGCTMSRERVGGTRWQFLDDQFRVKVGLAEMLKGGVIMDVTNAEQAKIAEDAGAAAVMALERVPADIRVQGGVARMSAIEKISEIQKAVSIPVMAKVRIGHIAEARILEALEVDFIDESEVLTPADEENHVYKHAFKVPFVCGCRNLGEALRRIGEGAAMMRTKGEAGSGDIVEAVRHLRAVRRGIKTLAILDEDELMAEAKELGAPYELVRWVAENGRLPVPNFAAGGIATPADAALCMMLGAESVFVGLGGLQVR